MVFYPDNHPRSRPLKRAIYSYIANNESRRIVEFLEKDAEWLPVLFHGHENLQPWLQKTYADAILADLTKLRNGYFDLSQIGEIEPIDAVLLQKLARFESTYFGWLEDTTGWNFSFHERRRYYYDTLNYWNTVIKKLKPDIFVAYTWPHLASDYPLYLLCKYCFDIPVLFLDAYPHLDQYFHTVAPSLEDLSAPFVPFYQDDGFKRRSPEVTEYLARLRSKKPTAPKHIEKYYSIIAAMDAQRYKEFFTILALVLTGKAFRLSGESFKKNKKPMGTPGAFLTLFDSFFFWERLRRQNLALKKIYEGMAQTVVAEEPFIYFAAPFQPESVSNLIPGVYEDPFLIIEVLSAALPKGWKIYYKEHPNTFKAVSKGSLARNADYYKRLQSYPKVKIISSTINTFELIDASRAVATAGGTVGWEAVVRGKPALLFGTMWYEKCKSVFSIKTLEDARTALQKIAAGATPDPHDVESYAEAILQACDKGLVTAGVLAETLVKCDDPSHELKRIASAFKKAYQRFY